MSAHVETEGRGSLARHRVLLEMAAMDKSDLEAALRRILRADAEVLGVSRVNCWVFEQDSQVIRCAAAHQEDGASPLGVAIDASSVPSYFEALAHDPILLADDARADPRTRELTDSYLAPLGITSMMDVPVWVRGSLWGVVCHEQVGARRRWTVADRDFATSIGHILSMAVEASGRAEAEQAYERCEIFVGILSHDLRSPLTAIRASAELLLRFPADDRTSSAARRVLRSTERMTRMIEQILDYSRIRLGEGLPVDAGPADLGDLCRRVAAEVRAGHEDHRIDVHVLGDPVGLWDVDRLWQLLTNLLVNAAEHGSPGSEIRVSVDGRDPGNVLVEVASAGAVSPDLVPVVFEAFQAPRDRGRSRGLGLGLFIAREIVTAHRGSIGLDARPDETIVRVKLPRQQPGIEAAVS